MARAKDNDKRTLILHTSKTLFAKQGFFNTSISDIKQASNLPVGTIYTYFKNKEEIVRVIIEEGWTELRTRLKTTFAAEPDPQKRLSLLLDTIFPELFRDIDLIAILLGEAVDYTRIEEKLQELTELMYSLLGDVSGNGSFIQAIGQREIKTALIIYFLGALHAVKLAKSTDIDLTEADILGFLKLTIRESLGVDL